MFAGHIGVALAVSRVEPRINVGLFVAASLLLDLLLWLFVLLGWETVVIPADFRQTHQPRFGFPYSHGLLFSVVWSATAGASVFWLSAGSSREKLRAALLLALVVVSHWLLDVLVHRPELPVTSAGSRQLGFGLWSNMTVALAVEAALLIGGLSLFFAGCGMSRARKLVLAATSLLVLAFTVVGMTVAPPPPSAFAMAGSSLAAILLVCVLYGWLGRGVGVPESLKARLPSSCPNPSAPGSDAPASSDRSHESGAAHAERPASRNAATTTGKRAVP